MTDVENEKEKDNATDKLVMMMMMMMMMKLLLMSPLHYMCDYSWKRWDPGGLFQHDNPNGHGAVSKVPAAGCACNIHGPVAPMICCVGAADWGSTLAAHMKERLRAEPTG